MPVIANCLSDHYATCILRRAGGRCVRQQARAFTITELMVATVIVLIVVLSTAMILASCQRTYSSVDAAVSAQDQASRAFNVMYRELSAAHNVSVKNIICSQCAIDFQLPVIQAGSVVWGAVDKNGQNQPGWNVEYRLNTLPGGKLQLIRVLQNGGGDVSGEIQRVITNDVEAIANLFQRSLDTVKIQLKITAAVGGSTTDTRTSGLLISQVHLRKP